MTEQTQLYFNCNISATADNFNRSQQLACEQQTSMKLQWKMYEQTADGSYFAVGMQSTCTDPETVQELLLQILLKLYVWSAHLISSHRYLYTSMKTKMIDLKQN